MNAIETRVRREYKRRGFKPLKTGWPDFLMVRETEYDIELVAVEAKSKGGKLTFEQWFLLSKLSQVMRVVVAKECSDGKIRDFPFDIKAFKYGR